MKTFVLLRISREGGTLYTPFLLSPSVKRVMKIRIKSVLWEGVFYETSPIEFCEILLITAVLPRIWLDPFWLSDQRPARSFKVIFNVIQGHSFISFPLVSCYFNASLLSFDYHYGKKSIKSKYPKIMPWLWHSISQALFMIKIWD